MMKIIGGQFKRRKLNMPKDIRPTQNIVREALFDIIGHHLEGLKFLDLFSGSGAIGIEAISRGVKSVIFVEKEPICVKIIHQNLKPIIDETPAIYAVYKEDAFAAIKKLSKQEAKFDIIYVDPPYGRELGKKALKTLDAYDILQPNCTVVIEHPKREILPEEEGRFLLFKHRKYGASCLSIYKIKS